MQEIDLSQTDLNLLVVLDVLLQERNVTRAAKRLHRTQSATSHALGRLRAQLGDPLLVRVRGEMRPTPKAERLIGELSRILSTIRRVLGEEAAFDPGETTRTFRLGGPDFAAVMVPFITRAMEVQTPKASLELVPPGGSMMRALQDGSIDLALAPPVRSPHEGLSHEVLGGLPWVVFARRGHPAIARWSMQTWCRYPHVRIRIGREEPGPVDLAARLSGHERRIGAYLPSFLLAPEILATTDMLLTAPREVLAPVAGRFGLVALTPPVDLEPVPLALFWRTQLERDEANRWFRGITRTAFGAWLETSLGLEVIGLAPRRARSRGAVSV